jgi:pyruvate dehydrogenase complex dehydrogenase (E1) component
MNTKLVKCSTDAKHCAKQIVTAAFNEILNGKFRIPSQEEMEQSLQGVINNAFNEYKVMSTIKAKHPGWDEERVKNEVYRTKLKIDKEYRNNLKQAASEAITDIENLISSLNETIKAWKITNLE